VDTWPVISPPGLSCNHDSFSPELRRAYTVLSMIAQSYVWCDAAKPCPVLPVTLAVPLHEAASALGLPSTVTLSALALWNQWSDDGKFNHQDTIRCMTTLTGTTDEEWFYSTMTAIQSYAGPIIVSTYNMLKCAVPNKNIAGIGEFLDDLADGLIAMSCTLWHLQDKCNPTILCTKLLPLFGTGNDFKGVVFKGVIDEHLPQHFERPSTTQLAAIYVFDRILGVSDLCHEESTCGEVRRYMPKRHRMYLEFVCSHKSLRSALMDWTGDVVTNTLVPKFNTAVERLADFRRVEKKLIEVMQVGSGNHTFHPLVASGTVEGTLAAKIQI